MAITYEWRIDSLTRKDVEDLQGVVSKINFTKIGTDDNGVTGSYSGQVTLPEPADAESFTAFIDLTKPQVIEWIETCITEDYHNIVNGKIEKVINEKTGNAETVDAMPWDEEEAPAEEVVEETPEAAPVEEETPAE